MIPDPAAEMSRVAAHPNFAIDNRDRWSLRVAFLADPVRGSKHRHDGTLDKRDGARQGLEPGGDPAALRPQKAQPVFGRDAARQDQLDRPFRRIDP